MRRSSKRWRRKTDTPDGPKYVREIDATAPGGGLFTWGGSQTPSELHEFLAELVNGVTEVTRQYALIAGTPAEWLKRAILREVHLQDPPSLRKRKKYFHTEDEEGTLIDAPSRVMALETVAAAPPRTAFLCIWCCVCLKRSRSRKWSCYCHW